MKKRKLNKDIRKSITHSWGRFISIMLLMALGSFALVGLTVTGPDMRQTAIDYFEELNTADLTIISDYGISETEQECIESVSAIKEVEYVYLQDVTIEDTYDSIRIFSKPTSISLYEIVDGKLPEEDSEIAISNTYSDIYSIGDTITFVEKADDNEDTTLKLHEFEIVGFINSGEILSSLNLGQTATGSGELDGYAVVNESVFDSDVYMMAKLIFTDTDGLSPYSDEYNDIIQEHKEELEELLYEIQESRLADIKSEYQTEIDEAQSEINNAKQEYNEGTQELNSAKSELSEKEEEYNEALAEFEKEKPDVLEEIADAQQEVEEAQEELDKLSEPTYSVYNRRETLGGEGYSTYETVSEIIDSLADVFPIFLYFVAALVTFTTMTRFVGDERTNSGTLESLGYSDGDIIKKFVIYGLVAGMTGTIIGVALGHILIPLIVYNAYKGGFTLPAIELHFYPNITIIAIILSLVSSVLPAIIVAKKELQENTAKLLQPKTPKAGSKILLEKIKPIWNKLNFTHKVTARNIFRYKNRMFMTIFGVAGASAILFTGFSVQSSISGVNDRQFGDIIKYSAIVALNDDLTEDEGNELQELLDTEEIKSYSSIYYEEVTKKAGDNNDTQKIKLIVPEDMDSFNDYISLINRETEENLEFTDDGVIISERLADLLDVKVGDSFSYKDSKDIEIEVTVSGICEMYAGHFMFMNKTEYENIYGDEVEINAKLLLLNDTSIENTQEQAAKFMELSSVEGIVQNTTLYNQINTIVESLDKIMLVLIIVAALLAIVILYNLTNINVEERIRELCTIKVLGFYDIETTMYIYRETIILSIIGVIFGWIFGIWLHQYILNVVPPDEVMFNPAIWIGAFIIPAITVLIVSFILKYHVNNKLKKVDMLETLKSVD